jgi:G6PDH family F420-dependent oxidoreductase
MFPGRFWFAPGSGENMNEHVTGDAWPPKDVRQRRLEECVDVIRRLHRGEEVTHRGLVTVEQARIWDVPDSPPPLIAPAISVDTARRAAAWADGLVTINQPAPKLRDMLAAYREAGGKGKAVLQVHLSWAGREEEAAAIALDQWRTNTFAPPVPWDLPTAGHFDGVGEHVGEEQVRTSVNVSASLEQHVDWLAGYAELGFDELYLHFVGQEQAPFIDAFAADVLPHLRTSGGAPEPQLAAAAAEPSSEARA